MTFLLRFLVLALFSCALAEKVGEWALQNFGRYCDEYGALCAYHLSIVEDNFNEDGPRKGWPCTFTILGVDETPANKTDFQDVVCAVGLPVYRINGGWDSEGFMVIVVTNTGDQVYAFFGYKDEDLEAGRSVDVQTRPAFPVGTYEEGNEIARRGDSKPKDTWEVLGLKRRHTTSHSVILMEFQIQQNDDHTDHCTLIVQAPEGQDVRFWSFYGHKCEDSDWYISWGYGDTGSAVMTVVNPERNRNAWFGWEHVNASEDLPDSGPSPVYPCKCG